MKGKLFWIVLFLGIIVRFFLAFSSIHPDLVAFYTGGQIVFDGHFWDLYDYIEKLPFDSPLRKIYPADLFIYPPLVYLFFGYVATTFSTIVPVYVREALIYDLPSVLGDLRLNLFLLLFKVSYLPFDLGIAFLFLQIFKDKPKKGFSAFVLWIFNPVNLYVTYMMGQFDVLPTFFVVFAFYLIVSFYKTKPHYLYLAGFSLGVGASLKIYPLLFIPLLMFLEKNWFRRLLLFFVSFGVYLLSIFPFLDSPGFRSSALLAGHTLKSFYATIPISGGQSIIIYLSLLFFVYWVFYFRGVTLNNLWSGFFIILLLFFVFTHYHPQWFLWIIPFLIFDLIDSDGKNWPLVLLSVFVFFGLVLFFDRSLSLGLFSPLFPSLFSGQSIWELLGVNLELNLWRSVLHSLFVSVALFYFYILIPKNWK